MSLIANPPYVRMEKLNKDDEKKYKEAFPEVAASRADILVYFFARAIELMRPGGWLAFITSNKYMRAAYGKKLRGFLRDSLIMSQVLDFGDLPVFAATSYPAVLIGQQGTGRTTAHQLRVADLTIPVRKALKRPGAIRNPGNGQQVQWTAFPLSWTATAMPTIHSCCCDKAAGFWKTPH